MNRWLGYGFQSPVRGILGGQVVHSQGGRQGWGGGSQHEVPWRGITTPYLSTQTTRTIWFFWLNPLYEALGRISGVGLPALLCMTVGSRVISFPRRLKKEEGSFPTTSLSDYFICSWAREQEKEQKAP